ncbi:hypothetical protein [Streptosporangium sp. NBC_01756]|uniref:hypothetical protein n=1 Tax=Streptosporangium sp. NBC_01756 TaxID=2975950 RepID=UPI002DDA32D3|nr:hypothetical protein [Streptosporangium sp. NBC_01756]WSC84650.1 hypothetical protein OIE48_30350 [Streptosporangium sp. NBC_01756]
MVRTHFDPEEAEEFEAAKDLLVRRCLAWAGEHGMRADEAMLTAALDARHRSRDGRLAHWDARQVRRFLLEWIPRHLAAEREVLATAPESLLTLLRYLAASGLRDPRGASPAELEAAVAEAAAEYPAALADPVRQGTGKFWAQTALDNGIVLDDERAVARFQRDIDTGRIHFDAEVLDKLLDAELTDAGPDDERAFSQRPVALPPAAELAAEAARSEVVRQLAALTGWVGTDGQPLTKTGNLRLADARELAALLGTGEQGLRARSSAELPRVSLLLAWAKKTGLVRVRKGRLVRVAKAAPVLRDPEALWRHAFEATFELGAAICTPTFGWAPYSMLVPAFDMLLPDVLNTMYSMPTPVPVARLQETVWLTCQEYFLLDPEEDGLRQDVWRRKVENDLLAVFDVLSGLGAVELSHGVPDELYSSDLRPGAFGKFDELTEDDLPLPPEVCARLLQRLAEPGPLVRLTPLGTRAVRERMLTDGRDAPLIGELTDATAGELLGVLAQHYPRETAAVELEGWLAAHGGDVEPLLDAIRACPFRTRAAAMLSTLVEALPDGQSMRAGLRRDPVLGTVVLTTLLEKEELRPEDLTDDEHALLLAEGLIFLLELGGPEAVMEQLRESAGRDAPELVAAVLDSGHPARVALEELRALVYEPMVTRSDRLRLVPSPRPGSRGRPSGRGKKRRH